MKKLFKLSIYVWILLLSIPSNAQNEEVEIIKPEDILSWKFKTNGMVYSAPIIFDEVVYVGSLDSIFYAIHAETGELKWKYKTTDPILSKAVVTQERILFESGNTMYCLNLKGEVQWHYEMISEDLDYQIDYWDFHHSSPVVYNDLVYVGTEKGLVYGLDLFTGGAKQIFRTYSQDLIRTTPLIYDEKIYVADIEGVMYSFCLKSQQLVWEVDSKADGTYRWKNFIHISPIEFNGNIFFGGRCNKLYCLNAQTGDKDWVFNDLTDQWLVGGPFLEDGVLYFGSSNQYSVFAANALTGQIKWINKLDGRIWGNFDSLDGNLYVGANSIYKINKESGEILSQIKFDCIHKDTYYKNSNFHSSVLIHQNQLYIGSDDEYIYCFNI